MGHSVYTQLLVHKPPNTMKLCLVLVLTIVGYVASENCRSSADCDWENCATGSHIACVQSTCTCNHQQGCTAQSDCPSGTCADGRHQYHCIDGQCGCGYFNNHHHGNHGN